MIRTPCYKCGRLTAKNYCPDHTPRWVTRPDRPSATQRGYTAEYRRQRKALLEEHKICLDCGTTGTPTNPITADHRIPLSKGGTNHPSNLEPRCLRCNSRKGNKT